MPEAESPAGQEERQQRRRRFVLGVAIVSYAVDTLWLGLMALEGVVPPAIPLAFGLLGGGISILFLLIHGRGWNLRLQDPNLTVPQLVVGYGVQLGFLALAPQVGFLFLSSIFVVTAFGILALTARQALWAWIWVTAIVAGILLEVGDRLAIPVATPLQQLLVGLAFVSAFGRVLFLSMWVADLRARLHQRNVALRQSLLQIEHLASLDALTATWNRRAFWQLAEAEEGRARRSGEPLSLVVLDLDHFKSVNDRFGHPIGDAALVAFVAGVRQVLRASDQLGRYGGEEFLLLLPATPLEGGRVLAERIRQEIERLDWGRVAAGLALTVSCGVVEARPGESVDALVARGDVALYQAKRAGRNRTVVLETAVEVVA